MRYLTLPGIPVSLSVIGIGGRFGEIPDELSFQLLDAFAHAGGTVVDTACSYASGRSERVIGSWLAARRNRDHVVIIDKGCHPDADGRSRVRPECLREDIDKSLARLGIDAIDLLLLHRDDPDVAVEAVIDALNEEVLTQRVRAFGASNWSPWRMDAANRYATRNGLTSMVAASLQFSLAVPTQPMWPGSRVLDDEARSWHLRTQLPLVAWSAQARGWFSGRHLDAAGDPLARRAYLSAENVERLARARDLAARRGTSPTSVALAAVLYQRFPVVALIGPETVAELEDGIRALGVRLSIADLWYLESRGVDSWRREEARMDEEHRRACLAPTPPTACGPAAGLAPA